MKEGYIILISGQPAIVDPFPVRGVQQLRTHPNKAAVLTDPVVVYEAIQKYVADGNAGITDCTIVELCPEVKQ